MVEDYILILAAVRSEVEGVLDCISHAADLMIGGRVVRCGRMNGMLLRIVVTGPGILNTVQALTVCVENARPLMMLQVGCGGGFRRLGMKNGDLAVAISEVDIHLGIDTGTHHAPLMDLPFSVLESDGRSLRADYPMNEELAQTAFQRLRDVYRPAGIGVFMGSFITGSTVTGSDERADFLFAAYSPCMESMEGAGAAFLSHYYHLPLLEIRCVSNMVGKRDVSTWDIALACRRAGEAAAKIIEFFNKERYDHPVISGLFHLSQ
jgi:futalosine hydrolase